MATVKRDLGRVYTHEQSLDRVFSEIQTLESNVASLLSGGTTNTSQMHHVDAVMATNAPSLTSFTVAVDGVTLVATQRVLLTGQTTAAENGIYVVGTVATGVAPLTRATDWDATAEVKANTFVCSTGGTINGNSIWQITGDFPMTVGTSHQHFKKIYSGIDVEGASTVRRVRAVTTTNLASFSGVSTTLDGLTLVENDRVLVSAQTAGDEEGIYVVGAVATGAADWTRARDWPAAATIPNGTIVVVDAGTAGANRIYKVANAAGVLVGTTNPTWERLYTSTELASTSAGKGASLCGLQDASGLVSGTNLEAAVATDIGTGNGLLAIAPPRRVRGVTAANMASFAGVSETFDGLTLVEGNRILVAYQTTPAENGIYVVGTVAAGVADWSRAADMAAAAVVPNGTIVVVDAGTVGANTIYKLTNAGTITIATTGLTFERIYTSTELAVQGTAAAGATLMGIYDNGGLITATNVDGALTEIKGLVDTNTAAIFQKRTVTVDETALSGASQAVNIGAALPANAVVVGHEIVVNTQGVLAGNDLTITVGGTDVDAIVASTDLDALAAGKYTGTLGAHFVGTFGAEQLVATFAAADLASLSAGNWTITVWFHVLA